MTVFIESLIGIVIFSAIVLPATLNDPMSMISDYPPEIRERCYELGLIEQKTKRFTPKDYLRKGLAVVVLLIVFVYILKHFNHADTFWEGFRDSYLIWLAIDWFDALVIDIGVFCHSKRVQIPGTEGMKAYKDYMFHIKQSMIGMGLGFPVCLLVGLFVTIL
ncbi:MAG: hypothetical protein IJ225_06845 [Solobacterium sp.]|nr:hypothetical protein [Solobacterium sp.]